MAFTLNKLLLKLLSSVADPEFFKMGAGLDFFYFHYILQVDKKKDFWFLRCFVDNFDVLSTKEQLVDERLREAFLSGLQTPAQFVSPPSARRLSVFASFKKKESSYGHVDIWWILFFCPIIIELFSYPM